MLPTWGRGRRTVDGRLAKGVSHRCSARVCLQGPACAPAVRGPESRARIDHATVSSAVLRGLKNFRAPHDGRPAGRPHAPVVGLDLDPHSELGRVSKAKDMASRPLATPGLGAASRPWLRSLHMAPGKVAPGARSRLPSFGSKLPLPQRRDLHQAIHPGSSANVGSAAGMLLLERGIYHRRQESPRQ